MKPKLIVMSHGLMAQEVLNSAKMIIGEIQGAKAICMMHDDGLDIINEKLQLELKELSEDEKVLIMVDLLGGTPSNVAIKEKNKNDNIEVIAGVNLSLIIEYAMSSESDVVELANYLIGVGKDSIQGIQKVEVDLDDEIEFD